MSHAMSQTDSPKNYWLISKKWPKRVFWGLLMAALLYAILVPMYCDYTDRARVSELMLLCEEAKTRVAQALIEHPGEKIALDAHALIPGKTSMKSKAGQEIEIPFREITDRGEIRLFSPQLGTMLVFRPSLAAKTVNWSCWGRPAIKVPLFCRGD